MSELFRNTLSGWQWAILAALPVAIIALYFLKLKRQPLEVPSTYLWKKSIEDMHVNSLWQRLRQNLLLFLQLLLIALAMLALLRPGFQGAKLEGQRFIFLIDNSASMTATDTQNGENRLAEAKQLVGQLIDQMESGMTAMIVSFADTPQVVQEFTDSRRLLRERLDTIEPTVRSTDLLGALELADGLANPGRVAIGEGKSEVEITKAQEAAVYIFSDGRFEDVKDFALGNLKPFYVPIGSFEAKNLAVTTFTTRRSEAKPEERQAFVQVANFTESDRPVTITIEHNGSFLDAREISVPAGETGSVVFPLADAPAGELRAQLKYELDTPTRKDALAQDDVAFAALNDSATGRVLVITPGNIPLTRAVATKRSERLGSIDFKATDFLASDEYKRSAENSEYDLVIYDQCAPATLPRANTVFIGRLPPGPVWRGAAAPAEAPQDAKASKDNTATIDDKATKVAKNDAPAESDGPLVGLPQILDWDRSHPILAHVELGDVRIGNSLLLKPPLGATVLIDSTEGPIAAISPRDAFQDAVLGFEIVHQENDGAPTANTTWWNKHSFPTFWLNTLEYLAGGSEDTKTASTAPGKPVEIRAAGDISELTVVDPAEKEFSIRRASEGVFQFHDTQRLGVYNVRRDNQVIDRFAVNLFDRQESDIRVRPSQDESGATKKAEDIRIGHVDVSAIGNAPARKELWKLVLLCALAVLVFEWYIYNRRVYL